MTASSFKWSLEYSEGQSLSQCGIFSTLEVILNRLGEYNDEFDNVQCNEKSYEYSRGYLNAVGDALYSAGTKYSVELNGKTKKGNCFNPSYLSRFPKC